MNLRHSEAFARCEGKGLRELFELRLCQTVCCIRLGLQTARLSARGLASVAEINNSPLSIDVVR
jgi:hypothetical protein